MRSIVLLAGIPGSGKTTLAHNLWCSMGGTIVTSGDIARSVDPTGVAGGNLAEESAFREAFLSYMAAAANETLPIIIDGFPRSRLQLGYMGGFDWQMILLTCRPDIARDRLMRRERSDDTPALIEKRIAEQTALLDLSNPGGWAWHAATWHGAVNTSQKQPDIIARDVAAYLRGEKREAY